MNLYDLPDEILVEADGPIRRITLNRPDERNPASTAMLFALTRLAQALAADPEARVAILTGAGKAFSAGGDFQHLVASSRDPELSRQSLANAEAFIRGMLDLPIPVIAAVNGAAVGFGATLAALCDIVLIADTAFIAEPHVNVGLVLGDGISVTWPFYLSLQKAKELIFTGERIDAAAAVSVGLANRVVPHAELMAEANALALRLAAQPGSALEGSKAMLNLFHKMALEQILPKLIERQFAQTQGDEHRAIVQGLVARQR